ncbi:S9 family peptidase [Sediminibacterium ginsengisoli]|uniref:Dipeptidyl aminopeptidase/acylaminoacyl peptidase n=1 Tax=Sediminibacterium ginsengisoli TaxID=413434 RepID=A0A1T4MEA0_9BACT|nr:prolyl oligopeptidase family serine peptidase [Sediminibacterium ginsengisoli]SJZ65211.1 Dipeptidyl aminopeptidase/acylaminoacyl peptidase [Sediminibacterium ginsengisoli]
MKLRLLGCWLLAGIVTHAQSPLTVEKIMQDPKWIGTSPSNVSWSADSRNIYFNWNPEGKTSDSLYSYNIAAPGAPAKADYLEMQKINAVANGIYNSANTLMVYTFRGDLFLVDVKTGKTTRITQTEDQESGPRFIQKDEWIAYNRNQNLYAWNTKTGITVQLTNIRGGGDAAPAAAGPAFGGRGGGAGFGGGAGATRLQENNRGGNSGGNIATQEQWLQQQQLALLQIVKERKEKRDQRTDFLRQHKYSEGDTLKNINIGDKSLQSLQISPDGRFVTYRLYQAPAATKNTIVPDYVTESGFTTDIPGRTKVGATLGKYEFYVYDKVKDVVKQVLTDSIPGITDQPDYVKDYPAKFANRKPAVRGVSFQGPYWNEAGTVAIVDIRSQDNKDRWIMELNAETGKLKLIDRQRDEAWIGGPGIGRIGWINDAVFYFQSEATGYSHLYTYDVSSSTKKALTQGKYEVQGVELSRNKQLFYLFTNEEHPGKQNWYRMKTDGTKKEKITSMEGGYEVSMSPDEKWIAYRYSYINKPWELFVQENAPGKKPVQITDKAMSEAFKAYAWKEPKVITIPAADGSQIYARIYEPAAGKKNNAAVFFVHGAGYLQNVHYWWSQYFREYMFNNMLADKGYTVLDIDYRASSGYGRDWRTGIYRFMGGKDLDDHVDAAKYLVEKHGIDPKKIGLYGGSYGGFITLMGLFTKPDVFKAGAALRPVTDWAHYNHGYTANILNEPFNDSIAYARSSPINFAAGLKNHLLICHGMVDVNVHFQDVVRLSQKLIELGKDNWELAPYPVEDHGFVEPSSWTDEYKRILKLFDTNLLKP